MALDYDAADTNQNLQIADITSMKGAVNVSIQNPLVLDFVKSDAKRSKHFMLPAKG